MSSPGRKGNKGHGKGLSSTHEVGTSKKGAGRRTSPSPSIPSLDQTTQPNGTETVDRKAALLAKFKNLTEKRQESVQLNQKQVHKEHADFKTPRVTTAQLRKLHKADKLQERLEAEETGQDLERIKGLQYSAESVARWNEKEEAKKANTSSAFTDYGQMAAKKYERLISKLQPTDTALSNSHQPTPSAGDYVSAAQHIASDEARDRLAQDLAAQEATRAKFSRRRPVNEEDEINFVNDRNAKFNKKIARAYDRVTADIKASFERGTAL